MKKKIIIISIILFGIVGIIVGISAYTKSFNENLENIEIGVVDLSTIDDGEYIGECSIFPIIVKVKVVVASHQITNVVILEHDNGQGEAAEAITSSIITSQTLQVDVIAGATYSSKVILKAVENALKP